MSIACARAHIENSTPTTQKKKMQRTPALCGRRLVDTLRGRTILVTGASRGVGRAVALRCAADGANVVLLGRSGTTPSHPSLTGTLECVANEVGVRGGNALVAEADVSDSTAVQRAVDEAARAFGGVDAVVNNASTLYLGLDADRATRLFDVNAKGVVHVVEAARPHLERSEMRHVLTVAPPLHTLSTHWAMPHPAYTASKYAMTILAMGYSATLRSNSLWPRKMLATAATKRLERETGQPFHRRGLSPSVFARAAHEVLCTDACGASLVDEDVVALPPGGVDDIFV